MGDPGPTRLGRQAREALAGHQLVPLEEPCPSPDLVLLFSAQLGRLPRWLPEAPCPSLLLVGGRDRWRVSPDLPVDAVRRAPSGSDPELHFPLDPPAFERDFGHPGPPPPSLRAQAQAAGLGSALFVTGLDDRARADFMRRTRFTITSDPELARQALACGSLPQRRPRLLDEPARRARLVRARPRTWQEAWERTLARIPERRRATAPLWWERHVYCSERRAGFRAALEGASGTTPEAANLRGCLLATLADFEPDAEHQERLRDEALACFERARPLGRLAWLNRGQLHLRRGESEEAVTVLIEAIQPDQPFREGEIYPRLPNQFLRWWHRRPQQRERLVCWKAWLLMAEHCPPFAPRLARQARQALPGPAEAWWQEALRERSRPRRQLQLLEEVLRREPLKLSARFVRIRTLWELGRKLEASRAYHSARELLRAFPYLEREARDLERLWVEVTTAAEGGRDPR